MIRLLVCLTLLMLVGCGPIALGAGIASLFDDGSGVDPTNIPQIEVAPHSLNDKGDDGIWAGPRIGLQPDATSPPELALRTNLLPDSPYIEFHLRRTNGSVEKLIVGVRLAPVEEFNPAEFAGLGFRRVDLQAGLDESLALRGIYVPELLHLRTSGNATEFEEQEYRLQFRVVDGEGRANTSAVITWTLDNTAPTQPTGVEADRNATGNFLEYVRWTITEEDRKQIDSYAILFLPDEDLDGATPQPDVPAQDDYDFDDLIDPDASDGDSSDGGTGNSTTIDIGVWRVNEADMNQSPADQSTDGLVTRFATFIPLNPYRVCLGVHLAVIAVDFANNRSELGLVYHANTSSIVCKESETTYGNNPAASESFQAGMDSTLDSSASLSQSQFFDLNGDGCRDILTLGSDGRIQIAIAVCEDGRRTGAFEKGLVTADDIVITEVSRV
jgi:hypothetical protein